MATSNHTIAVMAVSTAISIAKQNGYTASEEVHDCALDLLTAAGIYTSEVGDAIGALIGNGDLDKPYFATLAGMRKVVAPAAQAVYMQGRKLNGMVG